LGKPDSQLANLSGHAESLITWSKKSIFVATANGINHPSNTVSEGTAIERNGYSCSGFGSKRAVMKELALRLNEKRRHGKCV
jgi:hypothetical protein